MINLIPDMWLTTTHQDLVDDDIDGYGRLVIDIPDPPDNAVGTTKEDADPNGYTNTELRGYQPSVMEKEKSGSTHNTTKSSESKCQKVLPLTHDRQIPIKLLLKRAFHSSGNKPNKKRLQDYETENENRKLKECKSNKKELLLTHEHNTNQVEAQKRIDVINLVTNDANQRISPISHINTTVASEKPNTLSRSIESHKEKILSIHTNYSNDVRKQEINRACTEVKHNNVRNSIQNNLKLTASAVSPEMQNTLSSIMRSKEKEPFPTLKHHLNQSKAKQITRLRNLADNVNRRTHINKNATSPVSTDKQNMVNESIDYNKNYVLFTHKYCSNHIERQERNDRAHTVVYNDQRISYPNNTQNNQKTTRIFDAHHSSTLDLTLQRQNRQRISVVSNDFLFRHLSEREALGRSTRTNTQSQINNDHRSYPLLHQEALIDYIELQHQLALRENIPLTVNREPYHKEILKEMSDARSTEVTHISQRTNSQDVLKHTPPVQKHTPPVQQKTSRFANRNRPVTAKQNVTKNTPIVAKDSWNKDKNPGYNILVHRGPDVNRIVITLANENEANNNTIDQSFNGDQRVPERINHTSYPEASPPSHMKRSNYYKEPSLRSFRRRLPQKPGQRQTRKTLVTNKFESSELDNYNAAFTPHYSLIGNHYELSTPVIKNDYTLGARDYLSPVANGFLPWELHDGRPVASDPITRRSISTETNIRFNETEYHLDPRHEQQILFQPLNLSRKPITVNEIPYTKMFSNYPLCVQDYY